MEINCSVTVMPVYQGKVGFILRAADDSFGGLLVAPGGKLEPDDGVLQDGVPYHPVEFAAVRELEEETGLKARRDKLKYFCSLRLPHNNRIVVSMYYETSEDDYRGQNGLVFLSARDIMFRTDFAPGMKEEAVLLLGHLKRENA